MLVSLHIENIAVIEKADIVFDSGLNVLTGETGAGKSIVIDSINAVLGRADPPRFGAHWERTGPCLRPLYRDFGGGGRPSWRNGL